MANAYTDSDINQVLNNPGVFYFRGFGDTGSYTKSVFTNGSSFSYTPEVITQAFDDTGDVFDAIGAETGEVAFSFGKPFDIDFMTSLSGGLFTKETVTGGAQAVVNQVIAADWTNKKNIVLQLVDTDGVTYEADGEPAITSVTGTTAGLLTVNDDYTIVLDPNSYVGYSIVLNTAGTKSLVTTEVVTIVFNGPTVVGVTKMHAGGKKNYDAIEGYFETYLKDGTPAKAIFHKGYYNGNINLSFGTENSPEAAVTDVTISLKKNSELAAGYQMITIEKGE